MSAPNSWGTFYDESSLRQMFVQDQVFLPYHVVNV